MATVVEVPPVEVEVAEEGDVESLPLHKISVREFHAMGEAGVFGPKPRVELIGGYLVKKMTKKRPHEISKSEIHNEFTRGLPRTWTACCESPTELSNFDLPEPDVMIIRGRNKDYPRDAPGPAAVALVVEVADTSLRVDRGPKLRRYAAAGIPVYWIVDLSGAKIEVRTDPAGKGKDAHYRAMRMYAAGEQIPVELGGEVVLRLAVADLLP